MLMYQIKTDEGKIQYKIKGLISLFLLFTVIHFNNYLVAQDQCTKCHKIASPRVVREHEASIHFNADIDCTGCHGGNHEAEQKDEAHSAKFAFKGKFEPLAMLKLCADCHSDVKKMKFYRLDTNIYNEYLTSRHGELFLQGDKNVASCTTCHNTHLILHKRDPDSPVNKHNIPDTCGKCHSNEKMMKEYNLPTHQMSDYKEGVHGSILYGKRAGNPELVPTCHDCHGIHGAMPPEITKVYFVCGTCHFAAQRYFMKSPHYRALKTAGGPQCVTCHGNHKNSIPAHGLFISQEEGSCNTCHKDKSDTGYQVAEEFHKIAQAGLASIERLEAVKNGLENEAVLRLIDSEYAKAKVKFSELKDAMHSLALEDSKDIFNELDSIVKSASIYSEKIESKAKENHLTIFLVIGVIALVALIGISLGLAYIIIRLMRRVKNKNH